MTPSRCLIAPQAVLTVPVACPGRREPAAADPGRAALHAVLRGAERARRAARQRRPAARRRQVHRRQYSASDIPSTMFVLTTT